MKKQLLVLLVTISALAIARAAELSPSDKQFLSGYEQIHDALAADNLTGAKKAAASLPENAGADLAKSDSLDKARAAFSKLSDRAVKLASGHSGYHVFHCDMVNKDWVQTSASVANPYGGKEMVGCGEEKK